MLKELNTGKKCKIVTSVTPAVTSVTFFTFFNIMNFKHLSYLLRLLHLFYSLLFIYQKHSIFCRFLNYNFLLHE